MLSFLPVTTAWLAADWCLFENVISLDLESQGMKIQDRCCMISVFNLCSIKSLHVPPWKSLEYQIKPEIDN